MAWKNELYYNYFQYKNHEAQCSHPLQSARLLKALNPNFIPQAPSGRDAMINQPLEQPTRSYSKRGCFNSRVCRNGRANVGTIFGEKEENLQDKQNERAQMYAVIKHQGNNC